MDIDEEQKIYLAKIYRHGLNQLTEDTIPNKLISIHCIHWVIETLLRTATNDYTTVNYKSGFDDVFKKFCEKKNPPAELIKAVEKFNTIRNDMEHRGIVVDLGYLRELLSQMYKFVQWIMKVIFNSELSVYQVPAVEERQIFEDFRKWKETILPTSSYSTKMYQQTSDCTNWLYICIIPSVYSEGVFNLVGDVEHSDIIDQNSNGIFTLGANPDHFSAIEQYFRDYHVLGKSQVYATPKNLREYRDDGSEILLYPTGLIYLRIQVNAIGPIFDYNSPDFSKIYLYSDRIFNPKGNTWNLEDQSRKYGNPCTKKYENFDIQALLQIVCFPCHPNCKVALSKLRTTHFAGQFILPMMRYGPKNEGVYLLNHPDFTQINDRQYVDVDPDIVYQTSFEYDDISKVIEQLKIWIMGFFRNPSDTGYMY